MRYVYVQSSEEWEYSVVERGDESEAAPLHRSTAPFDGDRSMRSGQRRHSMRAVATCRYCAYLTVLLTFCCLVLLAFIAYNPRAVALLPHFMLPAMEHQQLLTTPHVPEGAAERTAFADDQTASSHCSLPSPATPSSSPELSADLLALLNRSEAGAASERLTMPGELTTVLSHIAMTTELQLPADVTRTTVEMLERDDAVLRAALANRRFVHARQLFSPLSDARLLKGDTEQMGAPDEEEEREQLLPLHDACSARRVLPINPTLDSRNAPAFYDYTVSDAIDEACSAGRRPAQLLTWSDNLCHDDTVYVHSLHQRITRASGGNGAGSMTFRVLGAQATHGRTGGVQRFLLLADDVRGDSVDLKPELKGRLVGPAIVAVQRFTSLNVSADSTRQLVAEVLSLQAGDEEAFIAAESPLPYAFIWVVEYEAFDSGVYMLELRTTWIKRAARWGRSGVVEKRPHALLHTVYRGVLDVTDYSKPKAGQNRHSKATMKQQPLCQADKVEHEVGRGRWLPLPARPNTTELYCDDVVCSGSNVAYLQDEHGFSIDYGLQWVWRPAACRLRLYSPASFAQCLHRHNYSDFYSHGDSLAREQYQNLVMLLDADGVIDLPKTQASADQLIKKSDDANAVEFHLRYDVNGSESQPLRVHFIMQDPVLDAGDAADGRRLLLWAPRLATGLYEERESWQAAVSEFRKQLALQSRQCRDSGQLCYLYVHPTVQAQHKNIMTEMWRDQKAKDDYHCNLQRMKQGPTQRSVVEVMDELKQWLHTHQQPQPSNNSQQIEQDLELFNMTAEEAATLTGAGSGMRILPADAITAARWDASHDALHYSAMCDFLECHLPEGRGCREAPPFKCPKEARPHYKRNWNGGVSNMVTMTFINLMCNGADGVQ